MKTLMFVLIIPWLIGCATSHEYCMAHLDSYQSYDQCYAEREARRAAIHQVFSSVGDGLKQSGQHTTTQWCTGQQLGTMTQLNCQ